MRAIATKFNNPGVMDLHVAPFSSRPVLHVREANKTPYALTFTDSVIRYGTGLVEEDLGEAYHRAGRSFVNQLSQVFVVLKEDPNNTRVIPARTAYGTGNGSGRGRGGMDRGRGSSGRGGKGRGQSYSRGHQGRGTKRGNEDQGHSSGYRVSKKIVVIN